MTKRSQSPTRPGKPFDDSFVRTAAHSRGGKADTYNEILDSAP